MTIIDGFPDWCEIRNAQKNIEKLITKISVKKNIYFFVCLMIA